MSYFKNIAQNFAINYAHSKMKDSLYKSLNIDIIDKNYQKIPDDGKKYMLYAHVPFCHVFCPYCSFHKYKFEESLCRDYFINLREEMKQIKDAGYDFETMYIGGGTPLIDPDELFKTVELAKELFGITDVSCETDPNNIDPKILKRFKGYIDRISVGVQSFDDEILKKVARYHKFGSQEVLIEKLQNAIGILPATSLDLIFNLPFQTKDQLIKDIEISKMLSPEQITFYPLMKSSITRDSIAKTLGISDEDNEKYFYDVIRKEMDSYFQNNAWAFSKTKSNLADEYVGSNHEYVGVGSGAFSFLNKKLLVNAYNLEDYGKRIKSKQSPVIATCEFKKSEILKYVFLTKLFDGSVDIKNFNESNSANIKKDLFVELKLLKLVNAIYEEDGEIKPTEFGDYLSLVLMKDFYTGMDKVRAAFKDDAKIKSTKKLKVMEEDDVNYLNLDEKAQKRA
ncbi:oxygen-independent coproporphyrinogen III oxidase [Campylobacter blaseri]|uniref:Coproporphyrinogen III oxidase n=1 Tax=Campylobacter blaseri TaxID=2042961 RepID=A0A2P8R0V2_9BACT|nr:coproporphyrinogen III oxidase family protein [Campylobacter blaseri]PSM52130.1 coproporphyrinogen III oxidase [Campylobacter blaseri]PSM53896.1 coproporphyrinogen III oxidase [Campylobacter blaseri]QKF85330.1 oxygen-independent coproporphyrinogen III oxidase [Campylobacter blaseri]